MRKDGFNKNNKDAGREEDMVVKALDKDIFLKNKQKSESFVHHADFLLPKMADSSNSNGTYLSMANYRINMIQKIANNSFPIPRTSTEAPEETTLPNLTNSSLPDMQRIKCANSWRNC